jgi:DNA polymerase delta subunit 2
MRVQAVCVDSKKFNNVLDYTLHYESIYNNRLSVLRERVNRKYSRIVSASTCWIVGTIYRDDKECIIEDESGRIVCVGDVLNPLICTGMVIGLYGNFFIKNGVESDGVFNVSDICYPEITCLFKSPSAPDCWIAFVCGLNIKNTLSLNFDLLTDFVLGNMPTDFSEKIARVVICGNSLAAPDKHDILKRTVKNNFGHQVVEYDPIPINILDKAISNLCCGVNVDVMPGESDPSSKLLP